MVGTSPGPIVKLAALTLARDEADIIEAFVRHTLMFVDRLYIVDDGSVDETGRILQLLGAEGLPITRVAHAPSAAFQQGRRTTDLMRQARAETAWDFLFPLDADEFICAPSRAALEAELAALPAMRPGAFSMSHYAPWLPEEWRGGAPLERLRHAIDVPRNPAKVIIPGALAECPGTLIADGNHLLSRYQVEQHSVLLASCELAHFPVRSAEQLAAKCLVSYVRWQSRPDYRPGMASHHLEAARLLAAQSTVHLGDPHALMRLYMPCSEAPRVERAFCPAYDQLRYTDHSAARLFERLLGGIDALIEGSRQQAADLERLQKELDAIRRPLHAVAAEQIRKLRRSILKRYFAGRGMVRGLTRPAQPRRVSS